MKTAILAGTITLFGFLTTARADEGLLPLASPAPASSPTVATPAPAPAPAASVVASPSAPAVVLGLGAGVYIPTSRLATNFLVGIDGAYQFPGLGRKLGLGLGLAYSQPTTTGEASDTRVPDGQADYSSTMRELMLDFLLSYRFLGWDSVWSPQAAIGPAFYFLSHKVRSFEHEQSETSTQVGFLLNLGADYRLGPGALTGEVRIPFAAVGQRTTGDSNVGALSIVVGYRFRL